MNDFLQQVEKDAGWIIESELARKVIVIWPDGEEQTKSALDSEKDLTCAFFQESLEIERETGYDRVSDRPVAVFRVRSLNRKPEPGERLMIKIQTSAFDEELTTYQMAGPPKSGKTIGYINLQLQSVSQI